MIRGQAERSSRGWKASLGVPALASHPVRLQLHGWPQPTACEAGCCPTPSEPSQPTESWEIANRGCLKVPSWEAWLCSDWLGMGDITCPGAHRPLIRKVCFSSVLPWNLSGYSQKCSAAGKKPMSPASCGFILMWPSEEARTLGSRY